MRYRSESKQADLADNRTALNSLSAIAKQNWRIHINTKLSADYILRGRTELSWYNKNSDQVERGYLAYLELLYKPLMKPYNGSARIEYFESDGYDARIYAYESDVAYNYSVPAVYGKGNRYYINISIDVNKRISIWCRWLQTIYKSATSIGSGFEKIPGNKLSELKIQTRIIF